MMKTPIGIVGAGAWGTALAYGISKRVPTMIYCQEKGSVLKVKRLFRRKVSDVTVTERIDTIFSQCHVLVLAIPFQEISTWFSTHERVYAMHDHVLVNASKGMSADTLKFFPQMVPTSIPTGVLSGPSLAFELLGDQPTSMVFASTDSDLCRDFQRSVSHEFLRIYVEDDPLAVSVSGALKNVLAIGSGIAHGVGMKMNAVSALVTRGIWEIAHLAKVLGGRSQTVFGLSGLGDVLVSCYFSKSRNMRFGQLVGKGTPVLDALRSVGTVEGYPTARAVYHFIKARGIEAPICEEVFNVLYKQKDPKDSVLELMTRPLKPEIFP